MCPSIAVLAGGGDAGGGSGDGAGDGSGDENAGAGEGGENAEGDSRGAPDYEKYPECGYASHPVDVVTGRAFTHPIVDLELPGPLPLRFARMYSSKMAARDAGLGFGWGHTFGWEIEVGRRRITVWNEQGVAVDFPMIPAGAEVIGPWGWVLRRETWGYAVDADDGLWHLFSASEDEGKRWRLTAIEDRNRNRIALTYDDGRLVELKDSAGRVIRVTPTREGRIGSIQVQNAITQGQWIAFATYTYDDRGDLAAATDADGFASHYEYDDDHRLTADTDRTGLCFHFVYDREGRCLESWGDYPGKRDPSLAETLPKYLHDGKTRAKGIHHCRFDYGPNGYSEVADSTQVKRFFGNRFGLLDKGVIGGGVTTARYDDNGHLVARTDVMGAITSYTLDARGRVVAMEEPLGRVTRLERDAAGLPISHTDPAGEVTTIVRDSHGNVLTMTDPSGATVSHRYDPRGLVTEVHHPNGSRTTLAYDAHGNVIQATYPNGGVHRWSWDGFGRMTAEIDAEGAETRYAYSNRGDLVAMYDALGGATRYSYDGEGRVTEIVSPEGRVTRLVWGGYHKLCAIHEADGSWVRLLHDYEGQLLEIRNERGEAHRYEYDATGRIIGEVTFDGRRLRYKNDLRGRAVRIEDDLRQPIEHVYNLAGELVERKLADGSTDTFEYNARGELVAARSGAVEVLFERDAVGRVVREIQSVAGETHEVEIRYDLSSMRVGRRTSVGHTEEIERDASGAAVRVVLDGWYEVTRQNDVFGREIRRQLPRGGAVETTFDRRGRLERRRALRPGAHVPVAPGQPEWLGAPDLGVTAERTYRFDRDDWLVETWDRLTGSTRYEYDAVNRLLALLPERHRGEEFRYDAAGSVLEAGATALKRAYGPGGRLERRGDAEYAWDAAGRLSERRDRKPDGTDAITRYTWDAAGRLASVAAPDATLVEFSYDAFSRRLQKRMSRPAQPGGRPAPVALTRFVWDGDTLVHEIRTTAGPEPSVEERTYCFEDTDLVPRAHRDGRRGDDIDERGAWYEYITDAVGTPERLVDAAGEVACELERTAWGRIRPIGQPTTTTPLRLAGQYEDEETGLAYNRFRYYDAETGLFISPDPLGPGGNLHPFAYAPNALTWVDLLGLVNLTPAAQARLAGMPSGPGVYHIESNGEVYTGSALDLKDRLCGSKPHPTAEPMLNDPNAKITIHTVDPGKGKTTRTRGRGVKVIEAQTMRANGNVPISVANQNGTTTNSNNKIPALRPEKEKKYRAAYRPKVTGTQTF
jgi:RHS repeat-associated protein